MPNWVTNEIIIKGDTLPILNAVLTNCGQEERDNVDEALNAVNKYATHSTANGEEHGLWMSSFYPIPKTFLVHDTKNYPNCYKAQADEQQRKYGVVGWYDYNLKYFGCKWDCEVYIVDCTEDTLALHITSPWDIPDAFMRRLKKDFGVRVFFSGVDEGFCFAVYGESGVQNNNVVDKFFEGRGEDEESDYGEDYEAIKEMCDNGMFALISD